MGFAAPLAIAATVLSAGVSAYGAIQQGKAASAASNYQAQVAMNNAKIAEANALSAENAGRASEEMQRRKTAATVGASKAAQGASGLDVNSGSALSVRDSEEKLGELDALTIRNNAARTAYGYRTQGDSYTAQAVLDKQAAKNSQLAGYVNGLGSLVSGASSVSSKWQSFQQSGAFGSSDGISGGSSSDVLIG